MASFHYIFGETDSSVTKKYFFWQENGEILLGTTSQELGGLKREDPDTFNSIIANSHFNEFVFKLKVKMDTYNVSNTESCHVRSSVASLVLFRSVY